MSLDSEVLSCRVLGSRQETLASQGEGGFKLD